MEILGQRPVWSMSGSDMLSTLDATYAEIARLETSALHLIAGLETTGHAQELGAGTTARLLTFRYRIDATKARRDIHLATSLDKYPAVAAALPNPDHPAAAATDHDTSTHSTDDADDHGAGENGAGEDRAGADDAGVDGAGEGGAGEGGAGEGGAGEGGAGEGGAGVGVLLHPAQAEAIVSALDKVPTTVAADDLRVAEQQLVELGRTHGPLDLRRAGRLVRDRLDTDGPEPAEQKAYDRESLTLKNADNGVAFTGYLANENAELFRTLIHTHAKPHKTIDGALDPRPRTKRQADALTTLLTTPGATTTAATTGAATAATLRSHASAGTAATAPAETATTTDSTPAGTATTTENAGSAGSDAAHKNSGGSVPGHGSKPHITVTIDFNDLKAATADKLGHLIYGGGLSAATIRRLACDAHILPIVLGSDSQPLDVGTTVRLATGPIRKALIARDRGCVCCGAPPLYCDAHHVKSWIDGGETKITNLVLLCKRCHRDLHAGHWTIQIANGVVDVARPAWATPGPVPRDRYRSPTTAPNTTKPTPRSSPRGAADATTLGVTTPGAPARAWPRDTDPPWITAEDAARLNPWGDTPDERPVRARPRSSATDFDPWGEGSGDKTRGVPTAPGENEPAENEPADKRLVSTGNVWGDAVGPIPNADRGSKPRTDTRGAFDPWGDLESDSATGPRRADDGPRLDRRTADLSGGDGPESADGVVLGDDGPKLDRHTPDPWGDSTELRDAATTAA
ncbi:DUF222 domain-containing protein [Kribbella sp. CWNU-51]